MNIVAALKLLLFIVVLLSTPISEFTIVAEEFFIEHFFRQRAITETPPQPD
jgi:hypothetical protein